MDLNPTTVLEMVRNLSEKGLVELLPDISLQLTEKGRKNAVLTIRKHRLWEVFLVSKLSYKWSEVHHLAEQLEHIGDEDMINRLEEFRHFPAVDPHGDPIPDRQGRVMKNVSIILSEAEKNKAYRVVSFADTDDLFLDYLSKLQLEPGTKFSVSGKLEFDGSLSLTFIKQTVQISQKIAANIRMQPVT